jgi:hypothetical protein
MCHKKTSRERSSEPQLHENIIVVRTTSIIVNVAKDVVVIGSVVVTFLVGERPDILVTQRSFYRNNNPTAAGRCTALAATTIPVIRLTACICASACAVVGSTNTSINSSGVIDTVIIKIRRLNFLLVVKIQLPTVETESNSLWLVFRLVGVVSFQGGIFDDDIK